MQYGISKDGLLVTLEANEDHTGKEGYAVVFSSGKAALQTSDTALTTEGVITDGAASGSKSSSLKLVPCKCSGKSNPASSHRVGYISTNSTISEEEATC